ncbi:DUF721 domain-containing protein [Flocculibacter collagenilyticus]|uniref:DUF721 domain-containing protein n=1 Tax=Flocculibacter collagenilyticus TaxID=2744479 RepID=UPI0018F6D61F|nr:DciA family protein [Flocculibacter collagenilyticus]
MHKQNTPQSLTQLLGTKSNTLSSFAVKGALLNRFTDFLAKYVFENTGLNISDTCQVSNYRSGMLVIETFSPAVAMRLNYVKGGILTAFRTEFIAELANIEIKVVPKEQLKIEKEPDLPPKHLSQNAANALRDAAQHVPDSLKEKLERLAALADKNKS